MGAVNKQQLLTQVLEQFSGNAGVKIKPFSPETIAALKTSLKLSRAQYRLLLHSLIAMVMQVGT